MYSGDYSSLTLSPIDVYASYGNNLSSQNPCKFKEKHSHLDRYEKEKHIKCNLFGRKLAAIHCIIIANIGICV